RTLGRHPTSQLFPYTTLFRSEKLALAVLEALGDHRAVQVEHNAVETAARGRLTDRVGDVRVGGVVDRTARRRPGGDRQYDLRTLDRKSTRLNSSHRTISYAVF